MNGAFDSGAGQAQPGRGVASFSDAGDPGRDTDIAPDSDATHSRMDESRRELKDLFAPPDQPARGVFRPRSKIMRSLTGNGGLALLAVGAGGLLLAKPRLVKHFVRMIPIGTLARMAAMKFMARRE